MTEHFSIKRSLGAKTAVLIIAIAIIFGTFSVGFSYRNYQQSLKEQLIDTATNLANTMAAIVEPESIERYLETKETDEAYWETLDALRTIQHNNDIEFAVVTKPTEEGFYYLYDTDESGGAFSLGDFQEFYEGDFLNNKDNFLAGNEIPSIVTNYEFGWLLSVLVPIKDEAGVMHGYVDVDMSMNEIIAMQHAFLKNILLILVAVTFVLTVLSIVITRQIIVKPINTLAQATGSFIGSENANNEERRIITLPKLETGDEVGRLYHSIRQMETDIYDYIDNLKTVTAEKERIGAELSVAKQIQASMLPSIFPPFPTRPEFDIFATMTPAKEVGGDFYDFFFIDDDHLVLVIADVSGKGVPAAMFMAISKVLLQNAAMVSKDPKKTLEVVNNQLCANNDAEMFVTVWIGILEISTGKLNCANAGHEYPTIKREGEKFELVKDRHGFVLAGMEGSRYKPYELELKPGDSIFVYTDGVPEATNINNELYGTDRMLTALNADAQSDPWKLLPSLKESIDLFVGEAPQFDDITMLSLRYNGIVAKETQNIEDNM